VKHAAKVSDCQDLSRTLQTFDLETQHTRLLYILLLVNKRRNK
jgi:hypothetical protein